MHKLGEVCLIAGAALFSQGEGLEKKDVDASDLVQQAYAQISREQYDEAVPNLCEAIKLERNSVAARRYLAFALLAQGQVSEASQQLDLLSQLNNQIALDLFMKGLVMEQMGKPTRASELFCAALQKEPKNEFFRKKAINELILLSKYADAAALCAEGKELSTDENGRKFYDNQLRHAQDLSAQTVAGRPCLR